MTWHRLFFWILLLMLPTQLGVHFWPEWAMVLGRRVDYLSPTLYVTDIIVFFLFVSWFFKFRPGLRIRIVIPVLLFAIFNIWIAKNQPVALYKWLKAVEFILLGWYIVRTKPKLSAISFPLSVGVLYSSILAIAQFFLQHSIGGPLWWLGERTFDVDTPGIARFESCQLSAVSCQLFLRPYATFPHPNVLGGFLAATLPLLIFNFRFSIFNQTKKFTIFKIITIVFGAIALLLTFSRSAIVVGGMAMLAALLNVKFKCQMSNVKSTLVVLVLALLFSLFTFHFSLFTFSEESVVVRQQLNMAAVKLWQQSPIVGIGLGNFLFKLPEALPSRSVYFLQPVHNIYLLVLTELGVVGLFVFLWFVLRIIQNFKFQISNFKLSLLALLLLGLIDHYPLTLQQGQLLLTMFLSLNILGSKRTIGK